MDVSNCASHNFILKGEKPPALTEACTGKADDDADKVLQANDGHGSLNLEHAYV